MFTFFLFQQSKNIQMTAFFTSALEKKRWSLVTDNTHKKLYVINMISSL